MFSYIDGKQVFVPDVKVAPNATFTYKAMQGYGYMLAAFQGEACVGYLDCNDLGFATVKDWLQGKMR